MVIKVHEALQETSQVIFNKEFSARNKFRKFNEIDKRINAAMNSQFGDFKQRLMMRKAKIKAGLNDSFQSDKEVLHDQNMGNDDVLLPVSVLEQSLLIDNSHLQIDGFDQKTCGSFKTRENMTESTEQNDNLKHSQFVPDTLIDDLGDSEYDSDQDGLDFSDNKNFWRKREEGMKELIMNENNLMDMSDERIQSREPITEQICTSLGTKELSESESARRQVKISENSLYEESYMIPENHPSYHENIINSNFDEKIPLKLSANKIYISSNQILTDDDEDYDDPNQESIPLNPKPQDHEIFKNNVIKKETKVSELEMEDIPINYLSNIMPEDTIQTQKMFHNNPITLNDNSVSDKNFQINRKASKCSELILSRFENFNQSYDSDKISVEDVCNNYSRRDLEVDNMISESHKDFIRSTSNTYQRSRNMKKGMNDMQSDIFMSTIGNNSFTKPSIVNKYDHTNIDLSKKLDDFMDLHDSLASYDYLDDEFVIENSKYDKK